MNEPGEESTSAAVHLERARFERRLRDAQALAKACNGLAQTAPNLCAQGGLSPGQHAGMQSLLGAFVLGVVLAPDALLFGGVWCASLIFMAIIVLRLAAALSALLARALPPSERIPDDELPIITYLIPLFREANVVADLVKSIGRIDYPATRLDVKFLVEADDPETIEALAACQIPPEWEILPIAPAAPRTKPKALNYGLAHARGEIVAVLDAEDRPEPDQARHAAAAFRNGGDDLSVVQAPLLVYNGDDSWISSQFEIEYASQFKVWLPFIARVNWPIALGGTSNYFRRDYLERAGGWDPWNVTEDADLGYRLARIGGRAAMIDSPTREEAPIHFGHWLGQRTRWMKGHIQTWLVLTRGPLLTAREMGWRSFLGVQITLGGTLLAAAMHGPLAVMLAVGPFLPGFSLNGWHAALLGLGYGSVIAAAIASREVRLTPLRLLTLPLYWPLLSIAMLCALWEMKYRPSHWSKTPHGVSPQAHQPRQA